jgi:hypothetical protein
MINPTSRPLNLFESRWRLYPLAGTVLESGFADFAGFCFNAVHFLFVQDFYAGAFTYRTFSATAGELIPNAFSSMSLCHCVLL